MYMPFVLEFNGHNGHIVTFVFVQCNRACLTWKSTKETKISSSSSSSSLSCTSNKCAVYNGVNAMKSVQLRIN